MSRSSFARRGGQRIVKNHVGQDLNLGDAKMFFIYPSGKLKAINSQPFFYILKSNSCVFGSVYCIAKRL